MAGGCSTEEQLLTLLSPHLLAVTSPVPALSHQPLTQEPPLIPALVSSIKRVERARVAAPLGWERGGECTVGHTQKPDAVTLSC